jgi:hypothetical protein
MATIKLTGFNTSTGRSSTAGDNDTVDLDGSLTIGNADTDAVVFNAEIDSDFIPDDNDTYDLGSSTKRWAQLHVEEASFEDVLLAELSISGVQLQTDTNAYRFNCPYALEIIGLRLNLDQHDTSGNVTVTVANGGTTMITLSITGTNTAADTGTVTSGTRAQGDVVTFAITATPTTNTNGLRASLFFRRTLS